MIELTKRRNLEQYISKPERLEILEDTLVRSGAEFLRLESLRRRFNFGEILNSDSFHLLFNEVSGEVNDFLGISKIKSPSVSRIDKKLIFKRAALIGSGAAGVDLAIDLAASYGNLTFQSIESAAEFGLLFGVAGVTWWFCDGMSSYFSPQEKVMYIAEDKSVSAVHAIAHEYSHYIMYRTGLNLGARNPITEGFACGMDKTISSIYQEKYDNSAYLYHSYWTLIACLNDVYLDLVHGSPELKNRCHIDTSNLPVMSHRIFNLRFHDPLFNGHHYCLGVTAMTIAEKQHGIQIYRDVLDGNFKFLAC